MKAACLSEGKPPQALPGSMSMRAIMWRIIMPTWKLPRYMLRRTADWIGFRCEGTALGRERNGIKVKYVKKNVGRMKKIPIMFLGLLSGLAACTR